MKNQKFLLWFFFLTIPIRIIGQGYICAVGGGSEDYNSWSDIPYSWIVEKSDSGKILILSYSDQSDWLPNYFKSLGAAEVENFKINSRPIANLDSTYNKIMEAKTVFIKGGDQWKYITYWKGTQTENAIREIYNSGGVIAGTSAGAMILGEFAFSAKFGSVYPDETLTNPFNKSIHIENEFLNLVPSVLFDTHFIQRGRFGRLIAFIFNIHSDFERSIIGIGIDDKTAICIDNENIGHVYGSGTVAIFQADSITKLNGENSDYSIENLKCDQLLHDWTFDFNTNKIKAYPSSVVEIDQTREFKSPKTEIWISGTNDLEVNISNGIGSFLDSVNIESLGVIFNQNYEPNLTELINYLDQNSIEYKLIPLENGCDSLSISEKIKASTSFIIAGDNFDLLMNLANNKSIIGKSFEDKINEFTPVYLIGDVGKLIGENYIGKTDTDENAAYYGIMTNNLGLNLFGEVIYQPRVFENSDYYENRTSSVLLGLMKNKKRIGIYSTDSDFIRISKDNYYISSMGQMPLLIVDASRSTFSDVSKYSTNRSKTRQTIGIDNLRYTISNVAKKFNFENIIISGIFNLNNERNFATQFSLFQNFPNPFNPTTTIKYSIPVVDEKFSFATNKITLIVFDILGREVRTLVNEIQKPGNYQVQFDAANLSSGIYFYTITNGHFFQAKKMMVIK